MFDRRLLGLVPGGTRDIAFAVAWKWLALLARLVALFAASRVLAGMLRGAAAPPAALVAVLFGAVLCVYVFYVCGSRSAQRAGAAAVRVVTQRVYAKLVALGPGFEQIVETHEAVQLMGEGVERLRPYFSSYLPQFFYALLAPLTVFVTLAPLDLPAAAVMLVCVPLMPASIMLLMRRAKRFMGRYWGTYVDLGAAFLDAVRGLTTLKVFQADAFMQQRLDERAEGFRALTMRLLRVQLNSVTLLDLFSYGGMAAGMLVAVFQAGAGALDPGDALAVVLLAPGFFLPMRSFGAQFHTGMNANEVIDRVFQILDAPEPQAGDAGVPEAARMEPGASGCTGEGQVDAAHAAISCSELACSYARAGDGSYGGGGDVALLGIELQVPPLTFTGVTGPSGSGKSTLLRALSGRFPDYTGSIKLFGTELRDLAPGALRQMVTLVSHDSHIFKGSVRSNLLLGKPDANDYEMWEALRKARLDDYVIAVGGLSTALEEGGANLSGGQRQRLCLARAILRDTPIYLFDEAASNVDAESEGKLLSVIQEMSLNKTVLFATHRLASLVRADEVFVLDGGQVSEHGTHFSLVRRGNGAYRDLWQRSAQLESLVRAAEGIELDEAYEPNEVEAVLDRLPPEASKMMYAALMARDALKYKRQVEGDSYDPVEHGHPVWIPLPQDCRQAVQDADAAPAAEGGAAPGAAAASAAGSHRVQGGAVPPGPDSAARPRTLSGTLRGMLRLMRGLLPETAAAVVLGALSSCAAIALPALAAAGLVMALGAWQGGPPPAVLAGALVACGMLRGPLRYTERLLAHDETFKTLALLRRRVFSQLRRLAPARLEGRDAGDLLSLLTADIETLEGFYSRTVVPVTSMALAALATVAALVAVGAGELAAYALVASAVVGLAVPLATTRAGRGKSRDLHGFSVEMSSFLLDSLLGFPDLLQFGRAGEYAEEMEEHLSTRARGDRDLSRTSSLFSALPRCAALACGALALLWVCPLAGSGALSPATVLVGAVLLFSLLGNVAGQSGYGSSLSRILASAERLLDVLGEAPQTSECEDGVRVDRFDAAEFEDVSFAYPGASSPAVRDVDLTIDYGELVRITGRSGAGKSTLLKLLMRFWDASSGSVRISGTDVHQMDTGALRALEAYMTQETYLFDATLRENLVFGRSVGDERLVEVLEQVRLDGLLARMPQGLDTPVGGQQGRGAFSEGERQRIGLARALLHDAQLLLLDEPTSNLDSMSEAAVLYALAATTQGKTVVVVSHRRAVAAIADATYVVRAMRA